MDKSRLLQLTNKIYRLTLLFPKKEPLRYKIRELADEILANLILARKDKIETGTAQTSREGIVESSGKNPPVADFLPEKLEVLDSFFEVAKNQNWVSYFDILEIQKEYSKIKEELKMFKREETAEKAEIPVKAARLPALSGRSIDTEAGLLLNSEKERGSGNNFRNNSRLEKILEILKEKEKAQVWEFQEVFSHLTKRTLRRDLRKLLKKGLVERVGERQETFYQIKS